MVVTVPEGLSHMERFFGERRVCTLWHKSLMRLRLLVLLLSPIGAALLPGQGPGAPVIMPGFPPELANYLQLTREQVDQIMRLNGEFNRLFAEKSARMLQVQREIVEWTKAQPLDPHQLGIRYAELEAIRRQLHDERIRTTEKTRAVLNEMQKARLRVLEEAMKLQPRIGEAVCVGLLAPPPGVPGVAAVLRPGTETGGPLGIGCGLRFPRGEDLFPLPRPMGPDEPVMDPAP